MPLLNPLLPLPQPMPTIPFEGWSTAAGDSMFGIRNSLGFNYVEIFHRSKEV